MARPKKDPNAPRSFQVSFETNEAEAEILAALRNKYREHYTLVNEDVDKVKAGKLVALAVRDMFASPEA